MWGSWGYAVRSSVAPPIGIDLEAPEVEAVELVERVVPAEDDDLLVDRIDDVDPARLSPAADLAGVDYLGVGPIYASPTKPDAAPPMAIGGLAAIAAKARLPIVAIGGLHAGNAAEAVAAGADGVAVVSAICAAPDPEAAARELRDIVAAARRTRG